MPSPTRSSRAATALLQVAPSGELLMARRVVVPARASVEMSHVECAASYATTGSLARAFGPGGLLAVVRPGSNPLRHDAPSFVVIAQPTFVAAPSTRRPTWNAATVVRPTVKLSGSTCVSCCAPGSVYGSRESLRPTSSQSRDTPSARSALTTSTPPPQRTTSRAPSYEVETRSLPGPASCVSRPVPPDRKSPP